MNYKEEYISLLKEVEKPARYIGNEVNVIKKDIENDTIRFAFCFPDLYEIGMSYVGLQILYDVLNQNEKIYCERVFAPAVDMEKLLRENDIPLCTLETMTQLGEMDFVGFTLQYELSYTNILNMLDIAKIPMLRSDRDDTHPIIIMGGPCAFNPEPIADFADIILIGDGEILLPQITAKWGEYKGNKLDYLKEICKIDGVYVPQFYNPVYNSNGKLLSYEKTYEKAHMPIKKSIINNMSKASYPKSPIVPFIDTVHDRAVVEIFRGCTRGCRFCQAGIIYRPLRERSKKEIIELARSQLRNTGHDELSLLSLSTSDYSDFEPLAIELTKECKSQNVSLSLPSLRLDSFSFNVLQEIQGYKKSSLTFAPEAGSQRLRDVINKGLTEDEIYGAISQALSLGWKNIKLYFMIGLPEETYKDLDAIAEMAKKIISIHKKINGGGRFNLTVSVSNFVPKAWTPFQWVNQNTTEEFTQKHNYLTNILKIKGVKFNYHDDITSTYEAVFSRGDRKLSKLLVEAQRLGCKFDSWSEHFDANKWEEAYHNTGIDLITYTSPNLNEDAFLPWDIIDSGVSKEFLLRELEQSKKESITLDCREKCNVCGISEISSCRFAKV